MRAIMNFRMLSAAVCAGLIAGVFHRGGAVAADSGAAKPPGALWGRLWEYPTIYKNDDAALFNEFRFTGRAQFDEYLIDSDTARNWDQDLIVRRLRIGAKARFFRKLTAHLEAELNPQSHVAGTPAYQRLTDAYLAWEFSDAATLTIGKQSVKFTLDGGTSSGELLTIDRNNVANNLWFPTEYISGAALRGKVGEWQYKAGIFSGGTEDREFGGFDARSFGMLSLGYDFAKQFNVKRALLRADYVHNESDVHGTVTRPFEDIAALVFQLEAGRWGFSADIAAGRGIGTQGDVLGLDAMPWVNLTKQLQAVFRYTHLSSGDPRGVRLARYDSFQTSQRGDLYHEFYAGLNYYFYGHRLKVQTGVAWVSLEDTTPAGDGEYHSVQWTTGLRILF